MKVVERLLTIGRRNVLVFTRFVEEAQYVADRIPGAVVVTGDTPPEERRRIGKEFRAGIIKVVCNCGVYLTGFDYPELESIVLTAPWRSLARYSQAIGRGVQIHPDKEKCMVVDMVGMFDQFGKVEDLV